MDGLDLELLARVVVQHREKFELAHQARRQVLRDETFVLEVLHREVESVAPIGAGDLREPFAVFIARLLADAPYVAPHRKSQRIRVDARVIRAVVGRLVHHVGVRLQKLQHETVRQAALVVQGVEQRVVPERSPAFVHDLGLPLRVKVLPDLAHDAHHLALPGLQQRCVFLDEIQQVFLGLQGETFFFHRLRAFQLRWKRAPQVVDLGLLVVGARLLAQRLLAQRKRGRAFVAVHAHTLQCVAGVQHTLDRRYAMALFTLRDVVAREHQVVDDGVGAGPLLEQVVTLEEGVMPVSGVGDHQRLHRQRVFVHQVGNAGVRVDDDLVRQAHLPAFVAVLGGQEMFAKRPVVVVNRHADGGVGVHHLLGADDLEQMRITVESVALGHLADRLVVLLYGLEGPLGTGRQGQRRSGFQ